MSTPPVRIGFLVFPGITQLDMTGPLQVFSSLENVENFLVWKDLDPVSSDTVLDITPTTTFRTCPQLDIICVPGGYGADDLMLDNEVLGFLREQAKGARYITSVCTGAMVLGAAGLLRGFQASTHWSAVEVLPVFGAIVSHERVCIDRNRVTGGGVTAGIDLALTLVSRLTDRQTAEAIQLRLEYNPLPPFRAGSPETAPADVLELLNLKIRPRQATRLALAHKAAMLFS